MREQKGDDGLFDLEVVQCHLGTIGYSIHAHNGAAPLAPRASCFGGGMARATAALRRKLIIKLRTTLHSYGVDCGQRSVRRFSSSLRGFVDIVGDV